MKNKFLRLNFEECGRIFYTSKSSGISEQIGEISGICVKNHNLQTDFVLLLKVLHWSMVEN